MGSQGIGIGFGCTKCCRVATAWSVVEESFNLSLMLHGTVFWRPAAFLTQMLFYLRGSILFQRFSLYDISFLDTVLLSLTLRLIVLLEDFQRGTLRINDVIFLKRQRPSTFGRSWYSDIFPLHSSLSYPLGGFWCTIRTSLCDWYRRARFWENIFFASLPPRRRFNIFVRAEILTALLYELNHPSFLPSFLQVVYARQLWFPFPTWRQHYAMFDQIDFSSRAIENGPIGFEKFPEFWFDIQRKFGFNQSI